MNDRQNYAKVKRISQLIVRSIFIILRVHQIVLTFTKKVLRVKRANMRKRKLVVAICLLNVAVPLRDESRKAEANRKRKL